MVANTSEEDVPAGWSAHFTLLRSGRKVKYNANSAGTGQKLFSKNEVIQYDKVQSTLPRQPQPTKRSMAVKMHSKNSQLWEIVEDANEHPDWLPHGWIVKFKTRNSGLRSGEIYKCYVDPSTGFKFYSKPEVFRYLETVKQNRCASKMETSISMQRTSKVKIKRCAVEDLPAGWIKDLKIRRNADRIRRDPEVQRYLETGEISWLAFLPEERDIMDKSLASPLAKRPKLERAATKRQLNAEELNDAAQQSPKDGVNVNGTVFKENSSTTCSAISKQKAFSSSHCKEDAADNQAVLIPEADIVLQYNSLENRKKIKTKNTLRKSNNKKGPDMPLRFSKRLAGCEPQLVTSSVSSAHAKTMPLVPTAVISDEKHKEKNVIDNGAGSSENSNDKKGLRLPLRSSKRLAGLEPDLVASSTVILTEKYLKQNVIDNGVESKEHSNDKKVMHLALRSSKRLAGLEPELVATSVSSEQAEPEPELVTDSLVIPAETRLKWNVTDNGSEFKENSNDKKGLHLPLRSSKRLAGLEPQLMANLPSTVQAEIKSQAPITLMPAGKCPNFNGAESRENANASESELPKSKVFKRNQDKEMSTDNVHILTPEVDIGQLLNCHERGMKRSGKMKTQSSSSKSGCKKPFKPALQSSKRLAGLESECVAHSESSVQALQNGFVSGKREPILAIKATMADEVSELHEAECRTALPCHAPCAHNSFDRETSNKSPKPLDDQAVPEEQSQELKTDNPLMNIIEKSSYKKTSISWCKSKPRKELFLPRQSSKRLSELRSQPIFNSISDDCALHIGARKSNKTKAIPDSLTDGEAQQIKAGPEVPHAHCGSANVNSTLHTDSSNNRKGPLDDHTVTKAKSGNLDTEKMNNDKPEPQVSFSFGDFWSDPCLEFAFKTLTGAIPIDHYLPIQSYFQQQVNASQTLRNGNLQHQVDPSQTQKDVGLALPDLGLPSFDISGHFDNLKKQSESQPQCTLNSCSSLPSGNLTLPSCSSITFEQPQWEWTRSPSRKANSLRHGARIT